MSKIKPNIVRGGRSIDLGNNMFLMQGRSHSRGGIDIGKNLEVEGGEVMQYKPNEVRVFSKEPILNGISPAQYVLGGANPNDVFNAQEYWKRVNRVSDDGTKYQYGGDDKNMFRKHPISTKEDAPQIEQGKYLSKQYKDYFSYFKDYNDYLTNNKVPKEEKLYADRLADYYFNDSGIYKMYFDLVDSFKNYNDKRKQYEGKYPVPTKGKTYKLKSIVNNKPTNKHLLTIDENILNYVYDEAVRGGVDPKIAIALATNESNLGQARQNNNGELNAFGLYSYWKGTDSVIYPNSKIQDPYNNIIKKGLKNLDDSDIEIMKDLTNKYNYMSSRIHEYEGDNVTADAVKYFLSGKYPGVNVGQERIDAYNKLVMSRFDELMNDNRFKTWYNSKNNKKEFGGSKFILNPAVITPNISLIERFGRKISKIFEPRDYSKDIANTEECAEYSNDILRKNFNKNIWGDAWTRNNDAGYKGKGQNKTKKVFSGYDGLEKPSIYSKENYWNYIKDAADNVKKNKKDVLKNVQNGDMVGMYFKRSPNTKIAFENGNGREVQTHTGHIMIENGVPFVYHNIHGDIVKNKLKKVIGKNKPFGVVSIYRPLKLGGKINKSANMDFNYIIGKNNIYKLGGRQKAPLGIDILNSQNLHRNAEVFDGVPAIVIDEQVVRPNLTEQQRLLDEASRIINNSIETNVNNSIRASISRGDSALNKIRRVRNINVPITIDGRSGSINKDGTINLKNRYTLAGDNRGVGYKSISERNKLLRQAKVRNAVNNIKQGIKDNSSELLSTGINLAGNLAGSLINLNAINKMKYYDIIPLRANKLKTNININPQLDTLREQLARFENDTRNNTSSSKTALARRQSARARTAQAINQLFGTKENLQTELINRDRLNQQQVGNMNVQMRNRWRAGKSQFDNQIRNMRAENAIAGINNAIAAFNGENGYFNTRDKKFNEQANRALYALTAPNAVDAITSKNAEKLINTFVEPRFRKRMRRSLGIED